MNRYFKSLLLGFGAVGLAANAAAGQTAGAGSAAGVDLQNGIDVNNQILILGDEAGEHPGDVRVHQTPSGSAAPSAPNSSVGAPASDQVSSSSHLPCRMMVNGQVQVVMIPVSSMAAMGHTVDANSGSVGISFLFGSIGGSTGDTLTLAPSLESLTERLELAQQNTHLAVLYCAAANDGHEGEAMRYALTERSLTALGMDWSSIYGGMAARDIRGQALRAMLEVNGQLGQMWTQMSPEARAAFSLPDLDDGRRYLSEGNYALALDSLLRAQAVLQQ